MGSGTVHATLKLPTPQKTWDLQASSAEHIHCQRGAETVEAPVKEDVTSKWHRNRVVLLNGSLPSVGTIIGASKSEHLLGLAGQPVELLLQAPKNKIRLSLPATQWIAIYNAHRPMK
ncbi:g5376 [Coccomyxa viridis]|uniref:G5376 protein n=1 Tax=Coccomyxa viridis TaxID=1274662 RepID=A0ABP1FSP0_9CHLO